MVTNRSQNTAWLATLVVYAIFIAGFQPARADDAAGLSARIDRLVEKHVQADGPGAAVLVVRRGKVVHRRGYGLADVERKIAIQPNTAFDLASVSKQFTAMAIMLLAERGELKYEDKVVDRLPNFGVPVKGRAVQIRDLLWHTSGLADYTGREWTGSDEEFRDLSTAGHFRWINGTQPRRAPGVKYEYNNSGYCLLAEVVQRTSRQSYGEFIRRNIFEPLAMHDTVVFDDLATRVPRMATGYKVTKAGEIVRSSSPCIATGDGNIFSTIDDLARWDAGLREFKLVTRATQQLAYAPGHLDKGGELGYGFGWETMRYPTGELCVWHTGSWSGTATYIARWIDHDFSVIVLSNNERAKVSRIGDQIGDMMLE